MNIREKTTIPTNKNAHFTPFKKSLNLDPVEKLFLNEQTRRLILHLASRIPIPLCALRAFARASPPNFVPCVLFRRQSIPLSFLG